MCDIFSKVLYNQRRTKARCRKDCALSCTPILCWQLLVSILTVWRGQVFSTLVSLGDWTRVEFLGNIQACLQTHRSRRKCTVNVRQFCKHWDTNSQQCRRIYHNHLFRHKAAKQRWKILPAPKGPVTKVCGSRQNPQMWRASVSFSLEFDFQKRAHTQSLRWLAYTISEKVGIHHLWVR